METTVDDGGILRFRGPEEEHVYNKWLMQKRIWAEREVILTDFPYSEMADLIHSCGWQRVAGKPYLAYPLLVKEFLANFNHTIEKPEADHRYTTWLTESLRIFHIFVCHNIDPTFHRIDFKESRAQFLYHLASGHRIDLGDHIFRFIVDLASQCASGRSPMFSYLISILYLADGVPLLSHEKPESLEPPIAKRTLGNLVARRVADNPAPIPAAEIDRLLRQIFTQLSEQGQVLSSIQRTQLAMQRTVDHMCIEIDSLKESNNTLRREQRPIKYTYDDVKHRMFQFAQRMDDIYTIISQPSALSAPHHGSTPSDPFDHLRPPSPHLPKEKYLIFSFFNFVLIFLHWGQCNIFI
ncbi:hypothetical protein Adt_11124 [Abeliophyllum distichum]|uniref:Uncharacterized protein n=1 Tax=Abeliophyllum distichum TaxID=126358 RepID=A0ABD1UNG9_9LAMI